MINLHNLHKSYVTGELKLPVLNGIDLHIQAGEFISIMGSSGSGKTTLLNIIGCLDVFDSGEYKLHGKNIHTSSADDLAQVRLKNIGFVFQQFNLIPRFTASRNVELPLIYKGTSRKVRQQKVQTALERVSLSNRSHHTPAQLSGGQQQRIAIARALVNQPDILVADEPTGSLDTQTGIEIMQLFQSLNQEGMTIIMVTHEEDIAAYAKRIVRLRDGIVVSDKAVQKP
ncbi:MAG TPA: ABC transporter ATP-binding protein [Leucothrix sp.]|nr:ABC transporter ATP-binding protein [Leucothrix sp.]